MALIYFSTYSGKANAADANYPLQGSARNVIVSGDGTGFPADYQWFNDFSGFFQRLLSEASVTPSGVADTVLASDYFDAFDALISGQTLPTASTSTAGITAYATSAETITGTEASKATTPAGVQAKAATVGETVTGSSAIKFVTPAGLNGRTATVSRTGIVELATDAETAAGLDTERAVTPAGLAAATSSGTWQAMTLLNGWVATRARYRLIDGGAGLEIDVFGLDHTSATDGKFYLLPVGFRPANAFIVVAGTGTFSQWFINGTGNPNYLEASVSVGGSIIVQIPMN